MSGSGQEDGMEDEEWSERGRVRGYDQRELQRLQRAMNLRASRLLWQLTPGSVIVPKRSGVAEMFQRMIRTN